jgi:hypothetical protein
MAMVKASAEVVRKAEKVAKAPVVVAAKKSKKAAKAVPAEKTPKEPKELVPGLQVGLTSKLGVMRFWGVLLTKNANAKLTDEQLEAAVKAEFPLRPITQQASKSRNWFNSGTYAAQGLALNGEKVPNGTKVPEDKRCVRWDEDGTPHRKAPAAKGPAEKVPGKTLGLKSKVGVLATWGIYFTANAKRHLTDEQLGAAIKAEFPLRDHVQPAARIRGWYNSGTYANMGLAPNGVAVDAGQKPEERALKYVPKEVAKKTPKTKTVESSPAAVAAKKPLVVKAKK